MISYAQNFEDVMLWRALKHVERGFYIDIGAQDPVVDSVSLAFYEQGWRGVHVEPTPAYAEALRKARPDETVVQAAVGANSSLISIFEIAGTGLSTGDESFARVHEGSGFSSKRIEVPCIRLADLLDQRGELDVHWLKIDVEGMEGSVLRSWTPSSVRPWIVVIEATVPRSPEPSFADWEPTILAMGYRFAYFDGLNRFYVSDDHAELLTAFAAPPNVFDAFTLSGTACNAFCDKLNGALNASQLQIHALQLEKQGVCEQLRLLTHDDLSARANDLERRISEQEAEATQRVRGLVDRLAQVEESARQERAALAVSMATQLEILERERCEQGETFHRTLQDRHKREQQLAEQLSAGIETARSLADSQRLESMRRNEAELALDAARRELDALTAAKSEQERAVAEREARWRGELERGRIAQHELASIKGSRLWRVAQLFGKSQPIAEGSAQRTIAAIDYPPSSLVSQYPPPSILPVASEARLVLASPLAMPHTDQTAYATSVDDLLLEHDEQFVRLAYLSVLGRAADPGGLASHLAQVRRGVSKTQLIVSMAQSLEGRSRRSPLIGLEVLVSKYQKRRLLRRLRSALARFISEEGLTIEQHLRAIHNDFHVNSASLSSRLDASERSLSELREPNRYSTTIQSDAPQAIPIDLRRAGRSSRDRIVFNLSTSKHWRSRAVGIIRVERELATHLASDSSVCFVYWDLKRQCFKALSDTEVGTILGDDWCDSATAAPASLASSVDFALRPTDVFVSVGLDWDLCPLQSIAVPLRQSGCKSIFACYDLVPILFPEFCVQDDFEQRFKSHFVNMAHLATSVFAVSEKSATDLRTFWKRAELETELPPIHSIRLANLQFPDQLSPLSAVDTDRLRHITSSGPYVLYVSSIEARKNHRLLINIWRELYRDRGSACPSLVLVGMAGWGTHDLLDQITRMQVTEAGKIIFLSDVNDDLLLHLYKNCSFSLFPSHYEGWGLAATEAMAFGKVCIVSSTSALGEATQNLMPTLHPSDFPGWKEEIERLVDDSSYREDLENNVRNNFSHRSWINVSKEFSDKLLAPHAR